MIQYVWKDIPENEQVEVEMVGQIWVNTDNNDIKLPLALVYLLMI